MTKIEAIAEQSAHNMQRLIVEAADEINEAISKSVEEAQLQDKEASFKLTFGITLKWDSNKMENDLSWSVKRKLSVDDDIPNPDQLKLPIESTIRDGEGNLLTLAEAAARVLNVKKGKV